MAGHLSDRWARLCPDRKVVAVCGNLHSRLAPSPQFQDLWPSFAACLRQINPRRVVHNVEVVFHGGSFYNERVRELQTTPLAEIELRDGAESGHSYALHLPRATPPTFLTPPPPSSIEMPEDT